MSVTGGIAAGLAFLPNWLNDAKDVLALDALLSGWVRTSGWRSAGLVWPAEFNTGTFLHARSEGVDRPVVLPPELPEVLKVLRAGTPTVVWQVPGTAGRLYALISPLGRQTGVVFAERGPAEPWTEADRNYLRLAARLIERSPALASLTGPALDSERLQQRLADASVIAGRMAHDFDNVLTGIIGFADLAVPLLPSGSQAARFVGEIAKVGQRGIEFTTELHQLSRSGQAKPLPGSVAAALLKVDAKTRAGLPTGAFLHTAVPAGLAPVAMDGSPLSIVLGHLIANAAEAIPAGGRVAVTSRIVEISTTEARTFLGTVSPGPHVEIAIQDTGPGIKPEVRARLFAEPFFTTKARHRGLGLAVVYRTLCAHRGGVRLDSAAPPDTGTIARVVIPPAAPRPAVAPAVLATVPAFGG